MSRDQCVYDYVFNVCCSVFVCMCCSVFVCMSLSSYMCMYMYAAMYVYLCQYVSNVVICMSPCMYMYFVMYVYVCRCVVIRLPPLHLIYACHVCALTSSIHACHVCALTSFTPVMRVPSPHPSTPSIHACHACALTSSTPVNLCFHILNKHLCMHIHTYIRNIYVCVYV
jgi:hypothetical protein